LSGGERREIASFRLSVSLIEVLQQGGLRGRNGLRRVANVGPIHHRRRQSAVCNVFGSLEKLVVVSAVKQVSHLGQNPLNFHLVYFDWNDSVFMGSIRCQSWAFVQKRCEQRQHSTLVFDELPVTFVHLVRVDGVFMRCDLLTGPQVKVSRGMTAAITS